MRALKFIFVVLASCSVIVDAEIVPVVSTKALVDSADLVIVAKVESVQRIGAGTVTFRGVTYDRADYKAELRVDETVKGEPVTPGFTLLFSTPSEDSVGNVAKGGLVAGAYRVVFLNYAPTGYKFVSPYYPSLPASPKSCGPNWHVNLGEEPYYKVLQRTLTILCTDSSPEEKNLALFSLRWGQDSTAAPFLKAALELPDVNSNPALRTAIVGDLLRWKDLSVLPLAEQDLFESSRHVPGHLKGNLVFAVSTLEPKTSIPLLARSIRLPEPETRLAAARFLEYTDSPDAMDVLLSALEDPDRQVQFAVMASLGNLTREYQWRPTTVDTESHWNACMDHWREFQKQRRTQAP